MFRNSEDLTVIGFIIIVFVVVVITIIIITTIIIIVVIIIVIIITSMYVCMHRHMVVCMFVCCEHFISYFTRPLPAIMASRYVS